MAAKKKKARRGLVPGRAFLFLIPAMTYSLALRQYHRRTGLNCCVRDGNRCGPCTMVTGNVVAAVSGSCQPSRKLSATKLRIVEATARHVLPRGKQMDSCGQADWALVRSAEAIAGLTRPAYQRRSLRRAFRPPKRDGIPSLGVGFTLRCFQRLSFPNIATQRCH